MFVAPRFPRSVYALKYVLCVFWYMLTCIIYNCTLSKDNWSSSCLLWRLSTKTVRQVGEYADTWYSAYRDSGAVAAGQLANAPVSVNQIQPMGWLYCCFVTFTYIDIGVTMNLPQCLHVAEPPTVWRVDSHWHCWLCSYSHDIISSGLPLGSPPVFLECTSIINKSP